MTTQAAPAAAAIVPPVATAIALIGRGRLAEAEALVRRRLAVAPDDVMALCVLGDLADRAGCLVEAERLFSRALALAPWLAEARLKQARVLAQSARMTEALEAYDGFLAQEPDHERATRERLTLLAQLGRYGEALAGYDAVLARTPDQARSWLSYGNVLKTVGRAPEAEAAFRRAIALEPRTGEAWWGLANLKFTAFDRADREQLEKLLAVASTDRLRAELHFTLGRLLEQNGDASGAFAQYAAANRAWRCVLPYDGRGVTSEVDRWIATFAPAPAVRLEASAAPIFVLGMPRAGSTLVEQLLSSHPLVEGTAELPIVPALMNEVWEEHRSRRPASVPDLIATLPPERLAALGAAYLGRAGAYRRTDRPRFVDKLPDNWRNVPLIHLMLPGAQIVDVRRAPTACCFANFKQHFAVGQGFSNALGDLADFYRDYRRMMDHVDQVMPGHVVRVQYEALVAEPEPEIRRLLDALGLPFDPACLSPHLTRRAVRTASAEQVRRPIHRDAIDSWRAYSPWLGELRDRLGDLAEP